MITLREMLNYIDFEMEIINGKDEFAGEKVVRLIDKQEANLGGVESEQFSTNNDFVAATIIDRLEIYWNDYIIESLAKNVGLPIYETYEKIYNANIKNDMDKNDDYMRCLYHLIHPTDVICVTDLENSLFAEIKDWDKFVDEFGIQMCYQFADDLMEYELSTENEFDKYGENYKYVPKIAKVYEGLMSMDDFINEYKTA